MAKQKGKKIPYEAARKKAKTLPKSLEKLAASYKELEAKRAQVARLSSKKALSTADTKILSDAKRAVTRMELDLKTRPRPDPKKDTIRTAKQAFKKKPSQPRGHGPVGKVKIAPPGSSVRRSLAAKAAIESIDWDKEMKTKEVETQRKGHPKTTQTKLEAETPRKHVALKSYQVVPHVGVVEVEKGKEVKGSGAVFKKIKGIPDKPVPNAKQQKNIDHYKAKGTTPPSSTPAGQFAISKKMWDAKYGETYERALERQEVPSAKRVIERVRDRTRADQIRAALKPKPKTQIPQTKKAVEGFVESTTKTLEAQKGRPGQIASKVGVLELADEPPRLPEKAGRQAKARKGGKAAAGKQVKFSGLPSWRDVVPDESTEEGRYLKGRMKNLKFFEKRLAQMEMDRAGPKWASLSAQEKKEKIAQAKRRVAHAKQAITDIHKAAPPKTVHGGLPAKVRIPRIPNIGPGALVPILWLDEYIKTGKTPAMIKDFLDIPNLPTYFKEAFKEIKDAIRNSKEKEAKNTLKHLIKRSRQYHPKKSQAQHYGFKKGK